MENQKRLTIELLHKKKQSREKIAMLTAYDYPTAFFLDKAGIDIILVGDSLGNVVLGYESTQEVTMADMLHHAKAVSRAISTAFFLVDMPFLGININVPSAVAHAQQLYKETKASALKIEVTSNSWEQTEAILDAGIPVMGHLGLTPQTVVCGEKMKVQGTTAKEASFLLESALRLEKAGCFALLLEYVPSQVAGLITERVKIPVVGCGAGPLCDGQVLVTHDIVGLYPKKIPRFVKQYADFGKEMGKAVEQYMQEIREGIFPSPQQTIVMQEKEWAVLQEQYKSY